MNCFIIKKNLFKERCREEIYVEEEKCHVSHKTALVFHPCVQQIFIKH